jgi:hypothetical protein
VIGHELAVEQLKTPDLQPRYKPGQGHFRSVGAEREHAFAKKRRSKRHSIKPSDQFFVLPAFYRVGVAELMKLQIAFFDALVDPGFLPVGAALHDFSKGRVMCDRERA